MNRKTVISGILTDCGIVYLEKYPVELNKNWDLAKSWFIYAFMKIYNLQRFLSLNNRDFYEAFTKIRK